MYYHVVANIDSRFVSMESALMWYNTHTPIFAAIPRTAPFDEDKKTPRICVAERLEDCLTAIGLLGRFRRCLSDNEDSFSYSAEGKEAYPVIIARFPSSTPVYRPTYEQVPDSDITDELWILKDTVPSHVEIVWFVPESIHYEERYSEHRDKVICACTDLVYYEKFPEGRSHPWINGKGHVMDSSEMWSNN